MGRPLLVGELNPYGADPYYALYPLPGHATGGRLAKILGMSINEYLATFERANLCVGSWSLPAAKMRARELAVLFKPPQPLLLLGSKVCRAFGVPFSPFTVSTSSTLFCRAVGVLPHPSGRCRIWNDPGSAERARALVAAITSP